MSDQKRSGWAIALGVLLGAAVGTVLGCGGVWTFLWMTVPDEMRRPHEFQGGGHLILMLMGAAFGGFVGLFAPLVWMLREPNDRSDSGGEPPMSQL
jgi:hypothetical protein